MSREEAGDMLTVRYQQGWGAAQEVAALVDQVLAHDRASL